MMKTTTRQRPAIRLVRDVDSPVVLCAADDKYIQPLAVTLRSAAEHLRVGSLLQVVLLDGGISESGWMGLQETLIGLPIDVQLIRPDLNLVEDFDVSHHITHSAYLRLLADRVLPDEVEKVIYLDSDLLVLDDVTELWEMPIGDNYCLAAVDIACPFVDALSHYRNSCDEGAARALPYVGALTPIPNWKALGIDGSQNYFNSGVMVLNLRQWRQDNISNRLLRCLRENRDHVWCWDQYALNVVFAGRWGKLPPRWNQGTHVYEYPSESCCPIEQDDFIAMRDQPAIVHYTTEFKPWKYRPYHPQRDLYFEHLDHTAFGGWRPEKPAFRLREWWDFHIVQVIRAWTVQYRKCVTFRRSPSPVKADAQAARTLAEPVR